MKITLDHNCIIDLEKNTGIGIKIKEIVANPDNHCYVTNIGASEMREQGIRPERYDLFEEMLKTAGIANLERLNPILIVGVTFIGKCVIASNEIIQLANNIESVLFGRAQAIDIKKIDIDSKLGRKWLNRTCDIHTMLCHIRNGNDMFLTSDANFKKKTKMMDLINLGARQICHPIEI